MAAAWNELPATGGLNECAALVRSAEALCVSAPELSVQLARRALLVGATDGSGMTTNAGEARTLSMRAHAVLAAGLVRINQHVNAVEPGFAALALAESGGALDVVIEVRLDLAACAQEVGEPLLGGALLRPVLETTQAPPSLRAAALGRLVGCIAHVARRDDVEDALVEADRLLAADDGLSPDARRMERARLAVRTAAYHRWYGDNEDAMNAARDGLAQLDRLRRELRSESDRLRARLVLELVCALLDEGEPREAESVAAPTVDEPVRATSAASVGQLMLAVATRVHLPAGQVDRGRSLLDQAAWLAERHRLDSLLADALTEVSRLDERAGRTSDALEALRGARAAEQRRLRAVAKAARQVLTEVGAGQGAKGVTQQAVAALLRQLAHPAGVPVAMAPRPAQQPRQSTERPPRQSVEQPSRRSAEPKTATQNEPPESPSNEEPRKPEPQRTTQTPKSTLPPPRTAPEPVSAELTPSVDKGTGLLNREGLFRRLRSVRNGERPVALTLLRFEPNNDTADGDGTDRGPDTGIMAGLADKVRDMAPDNAELARSDGGELAVLLPHTTRDQAEEFAATVRETAIESAWLADASGKDMSISTGVVQSSPPEPGDDTQVDAAEMLTAARHALTPAHATTSPTSLADTAEALNSVLAEETPTKPRPSPTAALTEDTPTTPLNVAKASQSLTVGRSILSSLSIPSGSGGRRRAGGEPPPGSKTRWPAEPTEAPRLTRAERRAQDSTWPPATGWPAEPDISQPLRHPAATAQPKPETQPAAPKTAPAAEQPREQPTATATQNATTEARSAYEQTKAELARMMSALTAGTVPPPAADPTADRRDTAAPQQSIPTTPDPDELPAPPDRRPDIPDPAEPDPIPPTPPEPGPTPPAEPGPLPVGENTRSGLMAAFEALTGPLPIPASTTDPATGVHQEADSLSAANAPATADTGESSRTEAARTESAVPEATWHPGAEATTTPATDAILGQHRQPTETSQNTTDGQPEPKATAALPTADGLPGRRRATEDSAVDDTAASGTPSWRPESAGADAQTGRRSTGEPVDVGDAASERVMGWRPGIDAGVDVPSGRRARGEQAGDVASESVMGWRPGIDAGVDVPSGRRARGEQTGDAASGGITGWRAEIDADAADADVPSGRRSADEAAGAASWRSGTDAADSALSGRGTAAAGDAESGGILGWRPGIAAAGDAGAVTGWRSGADAASGVPSQRAGTEPAATDENPVPTAGRWPGTDAEASAPGDAGFSATMGWQPRPTTDSDAGLPSGRRRAPDAPDTPATDPTAEPPTDATPDASTAADRTFLASFEAAPQLPSRKPSSSWADLQSSSAVESSADELFGAEPVEKRQPRAPFKSALGAAFAAFGEPDPVPTPAPAAEASVTPSVVVPDQPTYDEPIGPPNRPDDMPRRDRSDSTTIAGLLAEALAAYQSSTENEDEEEPVKVAEPLDRFDSFLNDSRFSGRHRSSE